MLIQLCTYGAQDAYLTRGSTNYRSIYSGSSEFRIFNEVFDPI